VIATQDTIIDFLTAKAAAAWEERQPYLLSLAGPDLAAAGIEYREILDGEKLKPFAERTAGEGRYQFVKHPRQRAKLAIVPHGADFHFESEEVEGAETRDSRRGESNEGQVLTDFLDALSKLPPEDIDGVVIPTRVLVKLARKR
jgi:hypothetical protein